MNGPCLYDDTIVLFGGPYSNLEATRAMRRKTRQLGIPPQRVICTGDLVAYCAEPGKTVDLIREWGIHVVMGNCEESLVENRSDCGCGFEEGSSCALLSDDWFPFANGNIDKRQRDWMAHLPRALHFTLNGLKIQVVHGSPSSINRFVFASTPDEVKLRELNSVDCDILVGGHCGIPFGERVGDRYWLNAGAIGLPANDGTADGWYLLLQPTREGVKASWHRLSYDWPLAATRMAGAGLSDGYRRTLATGCWPSMEILPPQERLRRGVPITLDPLLIDRLPGSGRDAPQARTPES